MIEQIKRLLGIAHLESEVKTLRADIKRLTDDITELTLNMSKFVEVECAECHKHFPTYPYGGGYYTSQGGRKFCSGDCLDKFIKEATHDTQG